MTDGTKLRIYNWLRVAAHLVWIAAGLCILVWIVYLIIRSNEDVADYQSLEVGKPTVAQRDSTSKDVVSVVAGQEITYTLSWKKNVGSPGNLYRSWLRMKYVSGQWTRDTKYPPILQSASFRVGRGAGEYTQTSNIEAPSKAAYYTLQIRAEYDRVLGADASVDEKMSNVVRIVAAPTLDLQGQLDALKGELNTLRAQVSTQPGPTAPAAQRVVTPTPSPTQSAAISAPQALSPSPAPTTQPVPTPKPRACVIGLLSLCILGLSQ